MKPALRLELIKKLQDESRELEGKLERLREAIDDHEMELRELSGDHHFDLMECQYYAMANYLSCLYLRINALRLLPSEESSEDKELNGEG